MNLNFLYMDYDEIRELLFQAKALSKKQAMQILYSWMEDPEPYYRFLAEGGAAALQVYEDYSDEDCQHKFIPSDVFILSPRYAKLFFNVQDNAVNALFATVVNQLTFSGNETGDIYAWPYLTMECAKNLNEAFLLNVIEDIHFIFDFSADENAEVYSCLYDKIYNACGCDGLLPINSFNLSSKWLHRKNGRDMETLMQNFFMANLGFGDGIPDATMRKLFIQYFMRCSRQIEDALQQYITQNN